MWMFRKTIMKHGISPDDPLHGFAIPHPIAPWIQCRPSKTGWLKRAADMLAQAKFPLIHAGTGIIHGQAHEELAALASLLEAPVSTSWGARSAMDERKSPNPSP